VITQGINIRISHEHAKEAAREFDHGRGIMMLADELLVCPKRLWRKAIPELRRRGYPHSLIQEELAQLECWCAGVPKETFK
jgi:hypothetical protein